MKRADDGIWKTSAIKDWMEKEEVIFFLRKKE